MENKYIVPELPLKHDLETKAILKQVNKSNKNLLNLKVLPKQYPMKIY